MIETTLTSLHTDDAGIKKKITGITELLATYRKAFAAIVENAKKIEALVKEMSSLTDAIAKDAETIKLSSTADERRIQGDTEQLVSGTQQFVLTPDHRRHDPRRAAGAADRPGHFRPDHRAVQVDARARIGQFRGRAAGPRPQGRNRPDGQRRRRVQDAGGRQGRTRRRRAGREEPRCGHRAPRRTDPLRRRLRKRRRRHRRQRCDVGDPARVRCRHADAHRGNDPGPVGDGRRRVGGSFLQRAVGGERDRRTLGLGRGNRPSGARVRARSPRAR